MLRGNEYLLCHVEILCGMFEHWEFIFVWRGGRTIFYYYDFIIIIIVCVWGGGGGGRGR